MQRALDEIDKVIGIMSHMLSATPHDHPKRLLVLECLGQAHDKRYELLEELDDVEKMIAYMTILLTLTPDDDPDKPRLLSIVGIAHCQRFQRLGEMEDMNKSIEYNSLALALTPDDHPALSRRLASLAVSHTDRFERLGEKDDIDKAIDYESRALKVTPQDNPSLSDGLERLGTSHNYRFEVLGELDDLEKAIEYQSRGLESASDDHPRLSDILTNLATSHRNRFGHLGDLGDLEKAMKYNYRALALTPEGHPKFSGLLANLGKSHSSRFKRLGELDDIEKAIQYQSRAVALTPDGHPKLPICLVDLGASHTYRFNHLGELEDLEGAIKYQARALALTPDDHPHKQSYLTNLGVSYKIRFQCLGDQDDLEKAIECESRALALTPDGHPHLPSCLANLGVSHIHRFEHLDKVEDIEKAIEYASRALALTPDGHPDAPFRLANLGAAHSNRSQCLGKQDDHDKAIECESRALAAITGDHPEFSRCHFNHALSYIQYYEYSNDLSHLQGSLHSFRTACISLTGAPRNRFYYARHWATEASNHSALNCIEAYQTTIDLLPQFIWFGATTGQRYQDLLTAEDLAVNAASAAILSSSYALALEWLEQARCVVWNQNLMLRSPLDQLQASHPALAARFQDVAIQLQSAGSTSREDRARSSGSMTSEQVGQEHRSLAREYNELLTKARTLPGLEDFLRPMKVTGLVRAARNGPIVVINCHEERCDALLILPCQGDINHIPLPNFNGDKARRARSELEMTSGSVRHSEREVERRPLIDEGEQHEFRSVLAVLWHDVVKPILDVLGFMSHLPLGNLPHITWCPTGAITFLPLHAAGDYDRPRSRVFDYVISSYTPTLTALLESTPHALSRDSRVLAIGQTATPGHSRLPGTAMELERVKAHTQDKAEYSQLINHQATTTAVLDAMEKHDWVHLACHAHQNIGNATESGFFLHDGVLDLASINRRSFKNKGLAFLSACQTATGDKNLPDEAVHLASGMLMAGYTSVIATMWSVMDSDAPLVADKVYSELMKDGKLGNGEAGKALHNAVTGLRERVGEEDFGRWVPFIHIGS